MICLYRKSFKTMSIAGHQFIDFKPLTDPCLCSAGSTVWCRDLELEKPCRFFFWRRGDVITGLCHSARSSLSGCLNWPLLCQLWTEVWLPFNMWLLRLWRSSPVPRPGTGPGVKAGVCVCVRLGRLHLTASISDIHRTVPTIPDQPPCSPDLASPVEEISLNEGLQNYFKFPFPVPMFFFFLFRLVMFLWLKNPK